ncbi:hypothetical protein ACFTXB_13765 [Streptomyces sp. NPDC057074]|uniref:hypothetical protein n=1 Tax=Streptomyces sp. NPDC057074 TaxID=3346015 RepID=UPI003636052D
MESTRTRGYFLGQTPLPPPARLPERTLATLLYEEAVRTQAMINRRHLGLRTRFGTAKMLRKFNQCYNPRRQLTEDARRVRCELPLLAKLDVGDRRQLYVYTRDGSKAPPPCSTAGRRKRRHPRSLPS